MLATTGGFYRAWVSEKRFSFGLQTLSTDDASSKNILSLSDLQHLKLQTDRETKDLMVDLSLMILVFTAILNLEWAAVYSSHWHKHIPEFQVQNPGDILLELR